MMRIIVAVTGASGVEMSYYLMKMIRTIPNWEIHLVVSQGAKVAWEMETERSIEELYRMADRVYDEKDLTAAISSGSFVTEGMIIMPCSMKTLAGIDFGYSENLIQRAADVCLKEGRKVVLVPREMPFGRIHLKNLKEAADYGCCIVPPVLTFYNGADTLEKQIIHIAGKVLLQFGVTIPEFKAWNGAEQHEKISLGK